MKKLWAKLLALFCAEKPNKIAHPNKRKLRDVKSQVLKK